MPAQKNEAETNQVAAETYDEAEERLAESGNVKPGADNAGVATGPTDRKAGKSQEKTGDLTISGKL